MWGNDNQTSQYASPVSDFYSVKTLKVISQQVEYDDDTIMLGLYYLFNISLISLSCLGQIKDYHIGICCITK